jgi:hypothetical protein
MQAPSSNFPRLHRLSLTDADVRRYLAALDSLFIVPIPPDTKNSLIALRNELRLSRPFSGAAARAS